MSQGSEHHRQLVQLQTLLVIVINVVIGALITIAIFVTLSKFPGKISQDEAMLISYLVGIAYAAPMALIGCLLVKLRQ